MAAKREKVVVAMSGGVDSSVAACLLVEQGYDVMGLFMRTGVQEPETTGDTGSAGPDTGGASGREATRIDGETNDDSMSGGTGPTVPSGRARPTVISGGARPTSARPHRGCCSASDAADARFVAGMLGIPLYVLNFEREFDALIDDFADEYAAGRTPNPCIVCNDRLKFGRIVEYSDAVGARYIATGHYARACRPLMPSDNGCHINGTQLLRGVDERKDQSYVLFGLDRAILDRLLFPVGHFPKKEVRAIATRYELPNRDKPDSVEICFAPDRDYARVVRQRRPDAFAEGDVIGAGGKVIGRHRGIGHYTIGQRRGLGIAAGTPIYVTRLDATANTVTMGDDADLLARVLIADRVNFLADPPPSPFRAGVKIRYLHRPAAATVELDGADSARVTFDTPQRAITPGQASVFYDGDVVLGGGWIT